MLNFASHELTELRETGADSFNFPGASSTSTTPAPTKAGAGKIIEDKIRIPRADEEDARVAVRRPRLAAHLEKSLAHFSATLLTGRTGTGKTALAADFARGDFRRVAWFKADATDVDWTVFSSYFAERLRAGREENFAAARKTSGEENAQTVTDALAAQFAALDAEQSLLIVLDDLHSVFDAEWFNEFFNALLSLPAPNVRLLLLARSQPPFPLWRLRSKHALDLVDEKLLAFTADETVEFFKRFKLSKTAARTAHKSAYGRIAKLKEIAEKKK